MWMAAFRYCNNTGWEKTEFSGWEKLNYSIKIQPGLNGPQLNLEPKWLRLNCSTTIRKLITSPKAYSSTFTTLEFFFPLSPHSHLSF